MGEALVLHLQVAERLDDDGGGGDRQDRAEEQRVHGAPLEEATDLEADPDHQDDFQERRDERRGADLEELAQAELQAEAEHQEDHPEFGQGLDRVFVVDQSEGRGVRADDEAGDDVAEDHRLAQAVEEDSDHTRHQHDHGEVLDEIDGMHGGGPRSGNGSADAATGRPRRPAD